MSSKAKAERIHAKRRAAERYDLHLSNHDLDVLAQYIRDGHARFVEKQSNRVSVFDVEVRRVDGEWATVVPTRVVYDRLRGQIVTFLPRESACP